MKHFAIVHLLGGFTQSWRTDKKYLRTSIDIPVETPTNYLEFYKTGQTIPTANISKKLTFNYFKTEIKGHLFWKKAYHHYQ